MRNANTIVAAAVIAAALTAGPATAHQAEVSLTLARTGSVTAESAAFLAQKLARISGGEIRLILPQAGGTIAPTAAVGAASRGTVDAAWGRSGWFAGKDGAVSLFSSVPYGPGIDEYVAWLYRGGGLEAARALFAKDNLHNIPCAIVPPTVVAGDARAQMLDLYVNKTRWDQLAPGHRALIELVCSDNIREAVADSWIAVKKLHAQGVMVRKWTPEQPSVHARRWRELATADGVEAGAYARMWQAYADFRRTYDIGTESELD